MQSIPGFSGDKNPVLQETIAEILGIITKELAAEGKAAGRNAGSFEKDIVRKNASMNW